MSDEMLQGLVRSHESALAEEERKLDTAQARIQELEQRVHTLQERGDELAERLASGERVTWSSSRPTDDELVAAWRAERDTEGGGDGTTP